MSVLTVERFMNNQWILADEVIPVSAEVMELLQMFPIRGCNIHPTAVAQLRIIVETYGADKAATLLEGYSTAYGVAILAFVLGLPCDNRADFFYGQLGEAWAHCRRITEEKHGHMNVYLDNILTSPLALCRKKK